MAASGQVSPSLRPVNPNTQLPYNPVSTEEQIKPIPIRKTQDKENYNYSPNKQNILMAERRNISQSAFAAYSIPQKYKDVTTPKIKDNTHDEYIEVDFENTY